MLRLYVEIVAARHQVSTIVWISNNMGYWLRLKAFVTVGIPRCARDVKQLFRTSTASFWPTAKLHTSYAAVERLPGYSS
jgi:hypothetical protein